MNIILVEFDFDDGHMQADAFKTKESLLEWYEELLGNHYDETENYLQTFKENIDKDNYKFNIDDYQYFTIYYNYEVM